MMKIDTNYSPNFRAKFIKNTTISKQIENTKSYKDEIVSCIQIDPQNKFDIDALENIAKYWADGHFVTNIYHVACAMRDDSKYYKYNQIFAVTKQKDNFENLNSDRILGLVHVSPLNENSLFIEHIEADPEIISKTNREYKGIGTAILNYLKTITNKITCFPSSSKTVKKFYFKNDFVEYPPHSNMFIWYKV